MSIYEEVEIEDMTFDKAKLTYYYPCPCGDKFYITLEELYDGEDVAKCPSCTLRILVIYDEQDLPPLPDDYNDDDDDDNEENIDDKEDSSNIEKKDEKLEDTQTRITEQLKEVQIGA